jgi:predicted 3-demethylubiquinone-9 3-methyltransferase (glyoxalase superfamily)
MMKQPIYPCLWFDGKAKDAANFYGTIFADSKIHADTPVMVTFDLAGQIFMGLNGGPMYKPNPSISFYVVCETEDELDNAWQKLLEGGNALMPLNKYPWSEKYGWLNDQFGISWQLTLGTVKELGQKITPLLMFTQVQAGKAEEAIQFYTGLFDDSSVKMIARYEPGEPDVEGTIKHAQFKLGEQLFMAMDSSMPHQFVFNEGISLVVSCNTQDEIDYYWSRLTDGGQESMCGWLKDRFGVSWQIVPSMLGELMTGEPVKANRTMQALLQMKKLDIHKLQNA